MGIDVAGWMEVKLLNGRWIPALNLGVFVPGYVAEIEDILFGLRSRTGMDPAKLEDMPILNSGFFSPERLVEIKRRLLQKGFDIEPVAHKRGLPEDASHVVEKPQDPVIISLYEYTWITWKEISEVDWDKKYPAIKESYETDEDEGYFLNFLPKTGPVLTSAQLEKLIIEKTLKVADANLEFTEEPLREIIPPEWQEIFDIMKRLAKFHKPEGVRLIVWFYE